MGFCKVYPWRTRRIPVETRGFCWKHRVLIKHCFFLTRGEPVELPWKPVENPQNSMGSRPPGKAEIRRENHTFFLQNQEIKLAKKAAIQLL